MSQTSAQLLTTVSARYITRLCKHWGHRFPVSFDEQQGRIDFGDSQVLLKAGESTLLVEIQTNSSEFDKLEQVVADHLQRFAPEGETLVFNWQRVV